MTFDEFMQLPLEGRKRIESAILDLDKAVRDEFGFSMLDTEKRLMKRVNESAPPHQAGDDADLFDKAVNLVPKERLAETITVEFDDEDNKAV